MNNSITSTSVYQLLSRREIEILKLIVEGNIDKEIAKKLGISFYTVRTHHQNILSKTGQRNSTSLVHFALKNGLNIMLS